MKREREGVTRKRGEREYRLVRGRKREKSDGVLNMCGSTTLGEKLVYENCTDAQQLSLFA